MSFEPRRFDDDDHAEDPLEVAVCCGVSILFWSFVIAWIVFF